TDPASKAAEVAHEQRELAKEADAPRNQGSGVRGQESKDKGQVQAAADRQAELARQLDRLDPKGAAEARKQVVEQMAVARKALEEAKTPAEAKEPLKRAAEAAENLAKQLAKEQAASRPTDEPTTRTAAKPADQAPRQMAQELAKQQRQLAQATE